jgi:hypothetical protein
LKIAAKVRLVSPDQLMKIFTVRFPLIMVSKEGGARLFSQPSFLRL